MGSLTGWQALALEVRMSLSWLCIATSCPHNSMHVFRPPHTSPSKQVLEEEADGEADEQTGMPGREPNAELSPMKASPSALMLAAGLASASLPFSRMATGALEDDAASRPSTQAQPGCGRSRMPRQCLAVAG